MFAVVITEKGGAQRRVEFDKNEITIGRVQGNDIILPKGNVSKRHTRIVLKDDRFIVVDLKSTNGTYVNGRKITSPLVIRPSDKVYIGDFILAIDEDSPAPGEYARSAQADAIPAPEERPPRFAQQTPAAPMEAPSHAPEPPTRQAPVRAASAAFEGPTAPRHAGPSLTDPRALRADPDAALTLVMRRVALVFDVHDTDPHALFDEERRASARNAIDAAISELEGEGLLDGTLDRAWLAAAALREAVGLGDLEPLMANESVREVVVEAPDRFLADLGGGLQPIDGRFSSPAAAMTVARRLLGQAGELADPSAPVLEATLPHGPHVTVVQPPVAVHGPIIEIRRMGPGPSLADLVNLGALSDEMHDVLAQAVAAERHIVVLGPAASGVTSMVGALASLAPAHQRLLVVEAVPDLSIPHDHVVHMAAGRSGRVALRQVIQQASALRSDRLVIDDLRGAEVLDALTALAARPGGGILGVHTAAPGGPIQALHALARLERDVPDSSLHTLIAGAAHLIVQLGRTEDGRRRVVALSEVVPSPSGTKARGLFVYDGGFRRA
jgi:pilus assembly protein CpaF